ncbi:hypothetical protein WS83_08890 [Burkholderia sp. MSMB2042]|nr:hypothetical protein WS78_22440 [Burkholderia savannae]KVG42012.1 hypothetical protein WS77_15615 [Burkholderia sp. MSMB0265]KVG89815.1 hypothetical protein WS81_20635 [Burkholderia sp. MSMB2040]KVG93587.1 hypothetical protein WS83_08890 [Burkholderia sp. MSMB2042]KVG96990.1 hypothetical protein WS82_01560 [Burkholderia sp. MSMB2041]
MRRTAGADVRTDSAARPLPIRSRRAKPIPGDGGAAQRDAAPSRGCAATGQAIGARAGGVDRGACIRVAPRTPRTVTKRR